MPVIRRTPGRRGRSVGSARVAYVLLCIGTWLVGSSPSSAGGGERAAGAYVDGEPTVRATLLVGSDPDGEPARPTRAGVLFDLAPGWHLYWRNPGATGLPTEVAFRADGARFGPIAWPAPEAFGDEPGAQDEWSFGYAGQVLLAAAIERADDAAHPPARLTADVSLLVCRHECIPADFALERPLAVDPDGAAAANATFDAYASRVPVPPSALGLELEALYSQSAIRPGDAFDAAIAIRGCPPDGCLAPHRTGAAPVFAPDAGVAWTAAETAASGTSPGAELLLLSGEADADEPIGTARLRGVLTLAGRAGARRAVAVDLPLPVAEAGSDVVALGRPWLAAAGGGPAAPAASPDVPPGLPLWRALLLALAGGLVLNLMPCVLPVLAIKVFGVAELARAARGGRRAVLAHGAAYTVGVLASMLALGGVVVALRAAGRSVGWGFQFQDPLYVAGVSALLVAFAMNLFGAYEIGPTPTALSDVGRSASGTRRSFFEGLLAVALATPCTAPFLGTAVGLAFASEPAAILAIFAAIGVGLAAPFALVALVPAWARWIPRSGAWLLSVRAALGFALIGTVVWLLSIFAATGGADGVVSLVGVLALLAFGLWGLGQLQRAARPRWTAALGIGVVLIGLAGLNAVGVRAGSGVARPADGAAAREPAGPAWDAWSARAVSDALAAGRPVFVRFTADWCVTCKVNERVVLADDAVRDELDRLGYARLVGDFTRRDEAIRAELARHGRAGVPLYLVYGPDRPAEPALLPELLTRARVLDELRAAARAL